MADEDLAAKAAKGLEESEGTGAAEDAEGWLRRLPLAPAAPNLTSKSHWKM